MQAPLDVYERNGGGSREIKRTKCLAGRYSGGRHGSRAPAYLNPRPRPPRVITATRCPADYGDGSVYLSPRRRARRHRQTTQNETAIIHVVWGLTSSGPTSVLDVRKYLAA